MLDEPNLEQIAAEESVFSLQLTPTSTERSADAAHVTDGLGYFSTLCKHLKYI